jgi:hypothetical protein
MDEPAKQRAIWRARLMASLLPLGSMTLLFVAAACAGKLDSATFFSRLTSPIVIFLLCLFIAILFPAYMRIYYILLLNIKGMFTAQERRTNQGRKQRWERYLLRAALVSSAMLVGLGVWVRWH